MRRLAMVLGGLALLPNCNEDSSGEVTGTDAGNSGEVTGTDAGNSGEVTGSDAGEGADAFHIDAVLASDINPNAPGTIGIVTWSVQDVSVDSAEIHFGLDSHYGMIAPVDLNEPDYRTLLLGMKPDRQYHFQVVATSGNARHQSSDYTINTGPVTNLISVTPAIHDATSHESGFIVSTQVQGNLVNPAPGEWPEIMSAPSTVFIIDGDGDIVWWYPSCVGLTPRARMSYDGKSMWLIPDRTEFAGGEIGLVSMDTLESTLYQDGISATHDGTAVDNEVLAYIDYGEEDCGSVFELHRDGSKVEIFESSDYIEYPPSYSPKACHLNAIRYNEAEGLYTVSDRENEIFAIDRQGAVQWRLTDIVSMESYGAQHHGHQLLPDSILLFANIGGDDGRSSAAIEFSLTDGTELFRYAPPGVSSPFYGDVQRLPGGNTLVTFSVAGEMHEVDPNGNLVMTVEGENVFGYAEWRRSLYGPPTDIQM